MSFYKKYILLNLGDYEAFEGLNFYATAFLWCLTVFIFIGIFVSNNRRNKMIRITKQILRHGARDESSAKTLQELGLDSGYSTKKLLAFGSRLSRTVKRVSEKEITYEEYITYEKSKKALKKRHALKKSTASVIIEKPQEESVTEIKTSDSPEELTDAATACNETAVSEPSVRENESTEESPFEIDFSVAKFYIPSEKETEARAILSKRETSVLQNVLTGVFLVAISVCMTFLLPLFLDLLNTLLS